jgi:glycosyltransferase involved in cell wall biosynthesis
MDAFVMPSLSEGLPLSLLEAMAAGLPSVITRVGGMPEVVRDGETGLIVSPGDVAALAERIAFLLGDAGLAAKIGSAARERVLDQFTVDRMAADYRDLYDQAIGGAAR